MLPKYEIVIDWSIKNKYVITEYSTRQNFVVLFNKKPRKPFLTLQ